MKNLRVSVGKSALYKLKFTLKPLLCQNMMPFTLLTKSQSKLQFGSKTSTSTWWTELESSSPLDFNLGVGL